MSLLAATAPQLQSLLYQYPGRSPRLGGSALPAALGQLSQLTSLSLNVGFACVTAAQVDAMVQSLPSLKHLDLKGSFSFLADGFPVSINTCCSQLETLHIVGGFPEDVQPELGQLHRLTQLMLGDRCGSLPANISQLEALQDIELLNYRGEMDLPEQLWRLVSITRLVITVENLSLPDCISQLTALKKLEILDSTFPILPLGLTACRQLTLLTLGFVVASPVLARLQSLCSLTVTMLPDQRPDVEHWTQLRGLTRLVVDVGGCDTAQYSGIQGMTLLQDLEIVGGSGLPEGPYLSRLQKLRLVDWNAESNTPAALRSASCLKHLELTPPLGLRASDIAMLVSLPANLETLSFSYVPYGFPLEDWNQWLSKLQDAYIAQDRAPPAIESHSIEEMPISNEA